MLRRTKPNEDLQKVFDSVFKRKQPSSPTQGHPAAYERLSGVKEVLSDHDNEQSTLQSIRNKP